MRFHENRERNKIFARKTRIKKKNELQALKEKAVQLLRENEGLLKAICGEAITNDVSRAKEYVAFLQSRGINAWVEDARYNVVPSMT